jgi:hypothetical protein
VSWTSRSSRYHPRIPRSPLTGSATCTSRGWPPPGVLPPRAC